MYKHISKNETGKIVAGLINDLAAKLSYYEMSIQLDANEKTIYKWRSSSIPKADKSLSLQSLHKSLFS